MKTTKIFLILSLFFVINNGLSAATVSTNEQISLEKVYCYPNPFNNKTEISKISFNIVNQVTLNNVKIYAVVFNYNGKKVWTKSIERNTIAAGDNNFIIKWGGENDLGEKVPKGLYYVKVIVESNNTITKIIKLLIK